MALKLSKIGKTDDDIEPAQAAKMKIILLLSENSFLDIIE
jgi:hypothetical protein